MLIINYLVGFLGLPATTMAFVLNVQFRVGLVQGKSAALMQLEKKTFYLDF
jgi:hypothetical protein